MRFWLFIIIIFSFFLILLFKKNIINDGTVQIDDIGTSCRVVLIRVGLGRRTIRILDNRSPMSLSPTVVY